MIVSGMVLLKKFFFSQALNNFWKPEQKSLSGSDEDDDLCSGFEKISL